jgi:DNA-binding transcriptional MerR regulator
MVEAVDEKRLYKIGEVCKLADVQPYVLRYWETEFPSLAPNKSGGGQRLYTRGEIDIILRIKQLLYSEGFTIAGAKKKLESDLLEPAVSPSEPSAPATSRRSRNKAAPRDDQAAKTLGTVKRELTAILALLEK